MEYINISAAAEKWGITVRRVQEMCKNGMIKGATRFGRAWMIPESTEKPADRRTREAKSPEVKKEDQFMLPLPRKNPFLLHTDLYNTPGTADKVIADFSDYPETAKVLWAQFEYRRGNVKAISENIDYFLKEHSGFNSTISAGILLAFCAIWQGDIILWRKARRHIYEAPCKNDDDRNAVDFWLAVTDSLINDTTRFPDWFRKGVFDCLHADSYPSARVFYVKYLMISAHDLASGRVKYKNVTGLGLMRTLPFVVEPMISQAKIEKTVIPEIYLHLIGATVYHNLGEDEKAAEHLDKAIELCLPDRLYGILVEYRSNLDALMDDRLALVDENALAAVKELHKRMISGWIRLHNQLLERNISAALTVREREVARLAAYGLGNGEIAHRLNIEVQSVKQYIFSAMNKVGAENRSELGLYI